MKVAIVGGGRSGEAIANALGARGIAAQMFSRSTGFDVLRDDAVERFRNFDVIIEATSRFTLSGKVATDFFTRSTRALAAAARASNAKHIVLSIVNCEKPELQGYGYFAGKAAQERVAREENPSVTIIRSTQWFEFAEQNLDRFTFGPFTLIPAMKIQPVALHAVAEVIADSVTGERPETSYDVAGTEVTTLWDMTESVRRRSVVLVPLPMPGATWRAIRDGGLLPSSQVERLGPSLPEWVASRTR
jgi:uncharacterized protein YbjT (DUF2867 family)